MPACPPPRQIVYLNFEDDRLLPIHTPELDVILQAHDELYPDVSDRRKYLFFPIDWALAYPLVTEPSIDVGKKLETAVFLHWRRQREDLGYLAGDGEVDLVVNRDGPEHVINVAYTVSASQTWTREIGALEAAAVRFPRSTRVLVAHDVGSRRPPTGVMTFKPAGWPLPWPKATKAE